MYTIGLLKDSDVRCSPASVVDEGRDDGGHH